MVCQLEVVKVLQESGFMPVDVHTRERYVLEFRGAIIKEDEGRFMTGVKEGERFWFEILFNVVQLQIFE